jgi:hypothetical protein
MLDARWATTARASLATTLELMAGLVSCRALMAELVWDGKYDKDGRRAAPLRVALPFQTIETVNESVQERQRSPDAFSLLPGRHAHRSIVERSTGPDRPARELEPI